MSHLGAPRPEGYHAAPEHQAGAAARYRLYAEYPGGHARLYPTSPTSFYSKIDEAMVRFEPEGADSYLTLVLEYSADESYPATRL